MSKDFVAGIIGIVMVIAFLGIMLWWVTILPLAIIMAGVMALLIWDWVNTLRYGVTGSGH